jgi:hypothetical protein
MLDNNSSVVRIVPGYDPNALKIKKMPKKQAEEIADHYLEIISSGNRGAGHSSGIRISQ